MKIYPSKFEYNNTMLLYLCDNLYSCRFGNFLCNNERDEYVIRHKELFPNHDISQNTISIFSFIKKYKYIFTNPLYKPSNTAILPSENDINRNLSLWKEYFLRWKENSFGKENMLSFMNSNVEYSIENTVLKIQLNGLKNTSKKELEFNEFEFLLSKVLTN